MSNRKIWVTSDLHLNHYNILELEHDNLVKNKLDYLTTVEQYNNMIINHINEVIGQNDILYILGDFAFGGFSDISNLCRRINGYKILILGNHDRYSVNEAKDKVGFDEAYSGPLYLPESNGRIILSHYPLKEGLNNPYIYQLHGHMHGSKMDPKMGNFINVNIAMNQYYPIDVSTILKRAQGTLPSRREKFLQEWFAPYYIITDKTRSDLVVDAESHLLVKETLEKKQKS